MYDLNNVLNKSNLKILNRLMAGGKKKAGIF